MITLSNRRRKEIAHLKRRKHRDEQGQYLVEGLRAVEAALASGAPIVDAVVTDRYADNPRLRGLVEGIDAPVYAASEKEFAYLTDVESPQGILAVARAQWGDEDAVRKAERVLVLDGVQDPGNAGALLRTDAWFGVGVVVAGPGTVDLYHPKVVRAAMGGLWDVLLVRSDDLTAFISRIKESGHACYAADLDGTPAPDWRPAIPSLLVVGNEAHGLSKEVRSLVDERLVIPGSHSREGTESLNVSLSAAILMYLWR